MSEPDPIDTDDPDVLRAEILRLRETLTDILAHHTGKSSKDIAVDTDRDKFLSAEDAKAYGLVDSVIKDQKPAKKG